VQSLLPLRVYGAEPSYFTGKLEGVLRFKELPYERISRVPDRALARATGVAQLPAVRLADDRWLTDTTPIIAWLDEAFPEHPVIPADPLLAFLSRLLEDYADEWLWRPAMHYRWDYPQGACHLSRVLADELMGHVPLPGPAKRWLVRRRQRGLFTQGDGVSRETWQHVEQVYLHALAWLGGILSERPYLLGARPSLADFGFFGPMFRHFSQDPDPARVMRETASGVYEWTARLWNARASRLPPDLPTRAPGDWGPVLQAMGRAYLPYLCANAEAWKAEAGRFDVDVEGAPYRGIRTSRYRVWCLEELRRHYSGLPEPAQAEARGLLEAHGCWEPLWRVEAQASGIDPARRAPFSPGYSMTGVGGR